MLNKDILFTPGLKRPSSAEREDVVMKKLKNALSNVSGKVE